MEMHTAMQGRSSGGRMDLLTFVLPALVPTPSLGSITACFCEMTTLRGRCAPCAAPCSRRAETVLKPQSQFSTSERILEKVFIFEIAVDFARRYHLGKDDFEAMIGSGTASDPGLAFAFCKGDANNTLVAAASQRFGAPVFAAEC